MLERFKKRFSLFWLNFLMFLINLLIGITEGFEILQITGVFLGLWAIALILFVPDDKIDL